jgi:hypothetical protein
MRDGDRLGGYVIVKESLRLSRIAGDPAEVRTAAAALLGDLPTIAALVGPGELVWPIDTPSALVGRWDDGPDPVHPEVDLTTVDRGRVVSRRHLRLRRDGACWHARAEPTMTNGLRVDGQPVAPGQEVALADGAEILLGTVPTRFWTVP